MRYDAGKLDKFIKIYSKVKKRTDSGSFEETLEVKYKGIKSDIKMSRGNESVIDERITAIHYSIFYVRNFYDITESDIIEYKKFKYDIISVIPSPTYTDITLVYANKTID